MQNFLEQHGPQQITSQLQNSTNLNNILALMKDSKINNIKKFLKSTKTLKDIKILDNLMEWTGPYVNYITFIQKYVYLFSRVFPNIIINGVVQNGLIHTYWDLSKTHSDKISAFCVK